MHASDRTSRHTLLTPPLLLSFIMYHLSILQRRGLNVPKDDSYLKNTKTAGAVVRSVLDEYNMFKDEMTFKSTRAVLEYDARYVHLQIVSL